MATATTKPPVKLSIRLRKNVKKDQIEAMFERIYRLSGCLTCGLNGFDLQLINESIVNPAVNDLADAGLAGIAGVNERSF
jgi:hypothetical protein